MVHQWPDWASYNFNGRFGDPLMSQGPWGRSFWWLKKWDELTPPNPHGMLKLWSRSTTKILLRWVWDCTWSINIKPLCLHSLFGSHSDSSKLLGKNTSHEFDLFVFKKFLYHLVLLQCMVRRVVWIDFVWASGNLFPGNQVDEKYGEIRP